MAAVEKGKRFGRFKRKGKFAKPAGKGRLAPKAMAGQWKKPFKPDNAKGAKKKVALKPKFTAPAAFAVSSSFDGLIFMCNSATKDDCFKFHVFGFPETKKDVVEQVKKGTKLFLYDFDAKLLHGVYKASSAGGMNLAPDAFKDSKRKFPAQVHFRVLKECAPLEESVFKSAIKENYYGRNKFNCELNFEQVHKLMQLFRPLDSRSLPKPKPWKVPRQEAGPKGQKPTLPRQHVSSGGFSFPKPPTNLYPPRIYETDLQKVDPYQTRRVSTLKPDADLLEAEAAVLYRQRLQRQLQEPRLEPFLDRSYVSDSLISPSIVQPHRPLYQEDVYRDLGYPRELPGTRSSSLYGLPVYPYESVAYQLARRYM